MQYTFLMILLYLYKICNIYLIMFFNLDELNPAFICANDIASLVCLFGVKFFNPFLSFTSCSSPSVVVSHAILLHLILFLLL